MRGYCYLGSRYISQRVFFTVIAVFVCIQMYSTFWNESHLVSDPTKSQIVNGEQEHSELSYLNLSVSHDTLPILLNLNAKQTIRNVEKYRLNLGNDSVVILVQVHRRLEDLRIMIESMKAVRYINQTLVVFSHDFYSTEIFQLVLSIDFCPVLQLFYPYPVQFYNESFPGDAKTDCPRNIGKAKAMEVGCYNAKYPDTYGHYREGDYTQIKHHWLWKQHFVFDRVRVLENFTGTVLRVDDDYYLAEDVIHVIRALDTARSVSCPSCLMYVLGEHEQLKPKTYEFQSGNAEILNYFTGVGRGMAFKRDFWDKFRSCAESFCLFDDYNWDWSLQHSAISCMNNFKILKPNAGRIFHIGTCRGFHRNIRNCDKGRVKRDIITTLSKNRNNLFPRLFKITTGHPRSKPTRGFGGWADPRDRKLCLRFFFNGTDSDDVLLEINKSISL